MAEQELTLHHLPHEMLHTIFQHVNLSDDCTHRAIAMSCKLFNQIYRDSPTLLGAAASSILVFGGGSIQRHRGGSWEQRSDESTKPFMRVHNRIARDSVGRLWFILRDKCLLYSAQYNAEHQFDIEESSLPAPPAPFNGSLDTCGLCCVGDELFTIPFLPEQPSLWSLDLRSPAPQWIHRATLAHARCSAVLAVIRGSIYIYAGVEAGKCQYGSLERFDPRSSATTVVRLADSSPMAGGAWCVHHDKLYVTGGYARGVGDRGWLDWFQCYDPDTNTWTRLQPMPIYLARHSMVAWRDELYVFGGNGAECKPLDTVLVYNFVSDTWREEPDMRLGKAVMVGAAIVG
eukprot:TRINITY_DN2412_c0_g1_i1.p1 TRINITY_DN2412_c0_g1~~TRINITY_DN2412_c0_g1_i1.p1  ORF type:complete len:345 (-),score=45.27 TRINITY_DN2412_c0_g1_i1:92-1126(-)